MASALSFGVSGVSESATDIRVSVRGFEFVVDEPVDMGGTNNGPNPVEYLLGSLAGCCNVIIHVIAAERGIPINAMRISLAGNLDPAKFMGKETCNRAGFESVTAKVEIDSPASAAEIDELLVAAESRCPVADNIGNATPVTLTRVVSAAI